MIRDRFSKIDRLSSAAAMITVTIRTINAASSQFIIATVDKAVATQIAIASAVDTSLRTDLIA